MRRLWSTCGALLISGAVLICASPGCESVGDFLGAGTNPAGNPLPSVPSDSVLLLLDNQSGVPVAIEAKFESQGQSVRRTSRVLTVSGIESQAALVRTVAERITVTARITGAAPFLAPARLQTGFLLVERVYFLGQDYEGGGTIAFSVPVPPPDCNDNGTPDARDIVAGVSADLNGNDIPDECETFLSITTCAAAVVLSAGPECFGEVPDLRGEINVENEDGPALDVTVEQTPPAGTPLEVGGPVVVTITAADSIGRTAKCETTVLLEDTLPPELEVPPDVMLECGHAIDFASVGHAVATDNCDAEPTVTCSCATSGNCPETIVCTWTAMDAWDNTTIGVQTILVEDVAAPEVQGLLVVGGDVSSECSALVTFSATVEDTCCIEPSDIEVEVVIATGVGQLGVPDITKTPNGSGGIDVSGQVLVTDAEECPVTIQVTVLAADCCGNVASDAASGDVTNCDDCSEPPPTGACCFYDMSCQELTEFACEDAGGTYAGDAVTCAAGVCEPTACCWTDGSCTEEDPTTCLESGGMPHPPGTLCSDVTCDMCVSWKTLLFQGLDENGPILPSELGTGSEIAEHYWVGVAFATHISWWGVTAVSDVQGGHAPCDKGTSDCLVSLYENAAGAPGELACESVVTPAIEDTGLLWNGVLPIRRYSVTILDLCPIPTDGWIRIAGVPGPGEPDCRFWLMSSLSGNGSCLAWDGSQWGTVSHDVALWIRGFGT
ncbi:MAG: hypothetical protein ABII12_15775 [Planctomycetota bacterium]